VIRRPFSRSAGRFQVEVINFDAMQVYRGVEVGTGKLSVAERGNVVHHMLEAADADQFFSAGEYVRLVRALLPEISARGRLPIMVGGTGLYLRALLEGLFEGPPRNEKIRKRLNRIADAGRLARLHRWLARIDSRSGVRIMPKDRLRIIRALEVYLLTRIPLSEHFRKARQPLPGYRPIRIGLNPPREELYARINRRVVQMIAAGWVAEVRGLIAAGVSPTSQAFAALGYRRIVNYLEGTVSMEELVEQIRMATRRYAKRQWTWFRAEAGVHWLDGFGDRAEIQQAAEQVIRENLC
jgi:tRNA dimethylallyltransferase